MPTDDKRKGNAMADDSKRMTSEEADALLREIEPLRGIESRLHAAQEELRAEAQTQQVCAAAPDSGPPAPLNIPGSNNTPIPGCPSHPVNPPAQPMSAREWARSRKLDDRFVFWQDVEGYAEYIAAYRAAALASQCDALVAQNTELLGLLREAQVAIVTQRSDRWADLLRRIEEEVGK